MPRCYWTDEESPECTLQGCGSTPGEKNQDLSRIQAQPVKALAVSAKFGGGKSTVISRLLETGRYELLVGAKTRGPRKLESNTLGTMPYRYIPYGKFWETFGGRPSVVSSNLAIRNENDVWRYWADLFSLKMPTNEQTVERFEEFFSGYLISDILKTSLSCVESGKILLFETTPNHEKTWKRVFPRMKILRIEAQPEVIVERIQQREEVSGTDPITIVIKILESLGMSPRLTSKAVTVVTTNNEPGDLERVIEIARSIYEGELVTAAEVAGYTATYNQQLRSIV